MKCKHPSAGPRIQTLDPGSQLPTPCSDSNAKNAILCCCCCCCRQLFARTTLATRLGLGLGLVLGLHELCNPLAPHPNSYLWAARLIMLQGLPQTRPAAQRLAA